MKGWKIPGRQVAAADGWYLCFYSFSKTLFPVEHKTTKYIPIYKHIYSFQVGVNIALLDLVVFRLRRDVRIYARCRLGLLFFVKGSISINLDCKVTPQPVF
jgi:hypothetical protein